MKILDLFIASLIPNLNVLLLTALGLILALEKICILGSEARKHINNVTFYVFTPALVGSSMAKYITRKSIISLWFMPVNILITFVVGSILGWILVKITRIPRNLQGLVLGCCAAGNMGNMIFIVVPTVCKERGSPFGDAKICYSHGMAYASLSMAVEYEFSQLGCMSITYGMNECTLNVFSLVIFQIGAIYMWSYVYNLVRLSSTAGSRPTEQDNSTEMINQTKSSEIVSNTRIEPLLPLNESSIKEANTEQFELKVSSPVTASDEKTKVPFLKRIKGSLQTVAVNTLKTVLSPSTVGALVGLTIGVIPQLQKILVGDHAPLRVVQDSTTLLGQAAIPTVTLIVGANLLRGLKGSNVQLSVIIGIIVIRFIVLPLVGVGVMKAAIHFKLVKLDPLYQFILLLQFALPPAIQIGTMTQLYGVGESECSVIMLWTYAVASVAVTLWSTVFLWFVG